MAVVGLLTGGDAANYHLTSATAATTASIAKRDVTGSITAAGKTYDGTDSASISSCSLEAQSGLHGVISGDAVGCAGSNGHFARASAGSGKAVSADVALSGTGKDNYQLTGASAATTASISKRDVTGSITASDKI